MTKTLKKQQRNSLDNYKALLDERAELYLDKKEIEDRIKELDADLRPVLEGRGAVVWNGFQFEVSVTAGRITYDTKAMLEDGMDLEPYRKEGKPSTRFTIKQVKEL